MTITKFPLRLMGWRSALPGRVSRFIRALAAVSGVAVAACTGAPTVDPRLDDVRPPAEPASRPERRQSYDTTNIEALDADPRLQKLREQKDDKPNPNIQHRRYSRGARAPFDGDFGGQDPPPDAALARRLAVEQNRIDGRLGSIDRTLDQIDSRTMRKPAELRREDLGDVSRETLLERERRNLVHRSERQDAEERRIEHQRRMRLETPAPELGAQRFSIQ